MEIPASLSALFGAIVGGTIGLCTQLLVFRYNKKKDLRKAQIDVASRLTGTMQRLTNTVFRCMEANLWCHYIVQCRRYGVPAEMELINLLKVERDALLKYDDVRSEVESVLTEYWGYFGNNDEEFTKIILRYRSCILPTDLTRLDFRSKEELVKFNVVDHLNCLREELEKTEGSHFAVSKAISSHIRFVIAPVK